MYLDTARLNQSEVTLLRQPFPFLIASDLLYAQYQSVLIDSFPHYQGAGFFPYQAQDCGNPLQVLIAEISSPDFADAVGAVLAIGRLSIYPHVVTLSDSIHRRHGTIHTDSASKIATALLYFNQSWPHDSAGCLRFLKSSIDIESMLVPEVRPVYGNFVAFARSDHSWHGHLPFEGKRKVLQIAWLASERDVKRKQRRGKVSRVLKKILGPIDKLWKIR